MLSGRCFGYGCPLLILECSLSILKLKVELI